MQPPLCSFAARKGAHSPVLHTIWVLRQSPVLYTPGSSFSFANLQCIRWTKWYGVHLTNSLSFAEGNLAHWIRSTAGDWGCTSSKSAAVWWCGECNCTTSFLHLWWVKRYGLHMQLCCTTLHLHTLHYNASSFVFTEWIRQQRCIRLCFAKKWYRVHVLQRTGECAPPHAALLHTSTRCTTWYTSTRCTTWYTSTRCTTWYTEGSATCGGVSSVKVYQV